MQFPWSPRRQDDGAYAPSYLALKAAGTGSKFEDDQPQLPLNGRRVLMICTEDGHMRMQNGKLFSTGNHPVETLVPMLHLLRAGFAVDVATPTGRPVKIETWAMPDDPIVSGIYQDRREDFSKPIDLRTFDSEFAFDPADYLAVLIPGGHGAMLGLPDNADVASVLRWAHRTGRYTLSLCHGPAALLSLQATEASVGDEPFLYAGYKMAAFPDSVDRKLPLIGYLPGKMPWHFGERLSALGVQFVNNKIEGAAHRDRNLVTGDSPRAANAFGKLSAQTLVAALA
ncbi:MAG: DJ-1/PfpI family protein [Acidimicrobiia bacterium]|nr:DJ-1/PfpI family protein [Acidimicrobiia bacterium]